MLNQFAASSIGKSVILFISIAIIVALTAWLFNSLLIPIIASFILYSLLEPMVSQLMRGGMRPSLAITSVLCLLIIALLLFVMIIIPVIVDQFNQLREQLPLLWQQITVTGKQLGLWMNQFVGVQINVELWAQQWLEKMEATGTQAVVSSLNVVVQFIIAIILIPLVTFFMLRDYRLFRNNLFNLLPNYSFELGWLIYDRVTKQMQRYVRGVLVQSLIVALVSTFGFYIIGVETPMLFGVLTGLFNIIPYIGPILAMLPPMLLELTSGGVEVWQLIGIVSVILIAQLIDNVLVVPSFIANSVGLHPLIVIFGVMIFGAMFGIIGMLVAIPILAVAKIVFQGLMYGLGGPQLSKPQYL